MRVAVALAVLLVSPAAAACSFLQPTQVGFDEKLAKPDDVAPPAPAVALVSISRGNADDPRDSCGDTGVIVLSVPATAENKELAFSFDLVSGTADDLIFQPGHFTGFEHDGKLLFVFPWVDGASDKQEPLDLVVRVTSYLRSGLTGAATEIRVQDNGR